MGFVVLLIAANYCIVIGIDIKAEMFFCKIYTSFPERQRISLLFEFFRLIWQIKLNLLNMFILDQERC